MADEKKVSVPPQVIENHVFVPNLQVKRIGEATESKFHGGKICYLSLLCMGGDYNIPASEAIAARIKPGHIINAVFECEPKRIEYTDFKQRQSRMVFIPVKVVDVAPCKV